ncbi:MULTISPECIES: geranylgeranyl reductase family protein [unclassified Actinopolyspora]|uniref:geranylgeranyl reductase family protein n=1 Tax=unclassified Actinopolyspora TaxID=2639451 RepID=UPI0013F5A08A|nr:MULTISPECIES: geranylgeranyl reductase family protein [unclassified Actinopolyspora]NHD16521.1 geranylgeranyl reductase family protein [Actinopolyspora sp. BKK2]NHE75616.1 geranylgeranyl reductase family protein [Actinopolyspora sp. BKK1]
MTTTPGRTGNTDDAEVIVVGAGPAGATAAAYLAQAGLDVLVLEKSAFPREKVCGDGLTPRGVKELIDLGVDTREEAGWLHNRGLRVVSGGVRLELDWPELADYPPYGVVRPRHDFDDLLVRHAQQAGARLVERTSVNSALVDERTGRIAGVHAKSGPERTEVTYRAPLVVSCDGVSGRLALSMGLQRKEDRPMGVAVRRYYESPRTADDYLESHMELWDRSNPADPKLLPGYGWIFGMGDGTVNVGLGALSSSKAYGKTNYRSLLRTWLEGTPDEWGLREDNATGKIGGAALPMGFNRKPHYGSGLLLVGDSGGMVNPFNGEGIAYAMESARLAAECVVQARARPEGMARERALARYPDAVAESLGGYFRMGNLFSKIIGHPTVLHMATKYGMPRVTLMRFVLKLMGNLYDRRGGDVMDRVISATTRLTPSA